MQDAGKVLRNEKVKTTDEFLVKKKEPLILPPDIDIIPEPGSISDKQLEDKENLKKILRSNSDRKKIKKGSSSVEKSIIDKILK